jgi:hypothetical protein
MTVIIGLEANCEDAVVLGADRFCPVGDFNMVDALSYLETPGLIKVSLSEILDFLRSKGLDKIKATLGRKIEVAEDKKSALAHTGFSNKADAKVRDLLLRSGLFLEDEAFLRELLFPIPIPDEEARRAVKNYREKFDLRERIRRGYSPEIRRIFDLTAVRRFELDPVSGLAYWDRNYNPNLSEYLFAILLRNGEKEKPSLLDISAVGTMYHRPYFANGCGGSYALQYIREQLGTSEILGNETNTKKRISTKDAVEIVQGAVEYAVKNNSFCRGFDYAILTPEGVENHFSEEKGEYEIDIGVLIDKRRAFLREELKRLGVARRLYAGKS